MEWGTPVQWGRFLLFWVPQSVKTKETNPTRLGSQPPCKRALRRLSCFLHLYSQVPKFPCECDGKFITLLQAVTLALKLSIRIPFQIGGSPSALFLYLCVNFHKCMCQRSILIIFDQHFVEQFVWSRLTSNFYGLVLV